MANNPDLQARLGALPRGGRAPKRPGLKVPIEGKAFSQATQSEPLPVVWGTQKRASTYIVPVFSMRATPIKQKVGKKKQIVGYNYNGTFAQAIGIGAATRLTRITAGDTEIWTGDLDQTSRDADGMTLLTTTIGTLRWYWGRADQNPDSLLEASDIDFGSGPVPISVPAWRNVIYIVANDIAFGTAPNPPSLTFEFERLISPLTLTAHHISRDAVIPEVIYELLNSSLYATGLAAGSLDTASFVAAAEATITEGIGASPWLDENTDVREFVGLLLSYIDGYLRYQNGKIFLELIRKSSTAGLQIIDESLLADEPRPVNEGWSQTWNYTRLVFTDRENEWEQDAVETYEDAANFAITGERIEEEIRLPFVTRRAVAKLLVKRKAIKGGLPAMSWELECLPSLRTLRPGDRVKLTYAKRGISERVVRILEADRSTADNRLVKLLVEEEITRDEANDYIPPADDFSSTPSEFALAATLPRLSTLTTQLKNGRPDGFLVACHRPLPLLEGIEVYWTWDPAQKAYGKIGVRAAFPAKGELRWWSRCRNNTSWLLRINFQTAADAAFVLALLEDSGEFYAAVGRRLYKAVGSTIDQHQVDVLWLQAVADGYLEAVSATELILEFTDQAFGSVAIAMETLAGQGVYPTLHIYIGRVVIGGDDDFVSFVGSLQFERAGANQKPFYKNGTLISGDTDLKRYVAVTTYNARQIQDLADAGDNFYDRNDTTMCPNGTYETNWGARVPTLAERFDYAGFATAFDGVHPDQALVLAVDEALYNTVFEVESDNEALLGEDTDDILGFITMTGAGWYNKI